MAHTKGNWKLDGCYVKDDANYPICQFFGASTYGSNWEANAKLIAAAPEQHKRLIESNEMLKSILSMYEDNMGIIARFGIMKQIKDNNAIIKKATE